MSVGRASFSPHSLPTLIRERSGGQGVLAEAPATALPAGVLFLSAASEEDSLRDPACDPLHTAWSEHGQSVGEGDDLRTWLRTKFFKHHEELAWVSIHRWTSSTLQTLLADHLLPERRRLEGELEDLRQARAKGEKGGKVSRRNAASPRFKHSWTNWPASSTR
jgi:hypothetical protein